MNEILALIPAAGKSVRMGQPKLSLPLGDCSVLTRVIEAFRQAGVDTILVVLAPHTADLASLAENVGAQTLLLTQETPDMRATVEQGLNRLETHHQPSRQSFWFLCPADHPTLDVDVIRKLIQIQKTHPEHSLFVPTFQGKRGHPTLIAWNHVKEIRSLPPNTGLNVYFRDPAKFGHMGETLEVPVETDEILRDLDTPEDYEKLVQKWAEGTG